MASRELSAQPASTASSQRIGGHYDVVEELGRGGMAVVYRVLDARSGKSLALKQLLKQRDDKHARESELLFEREYHTLAQLAHPRVIEVHDYGVDEAGPFYTMELLDGGDLRERSPLPWREACELIYDVCSSLALLHSRRLVHRDVSPRNVRCTHDRHAKLIDFGAMVPMGTNAQVVGTPPFVAPEAVHGSALDARTDLFSLGTTLYFALTGRLAYPARSFAQLVESWSNKPAPPSAIVAELPPALDRLVMSLISLEAAPRPRSAFEVMQRLAAVAGIHREEPLSVSKAYLVTPSLVARDEQLTKFREVLGRAQHGRGRGLLVAAPSGMGRSRMLDACALEAKLVGSCVLRIAATSGGDHELSAAHSLAEQLVSLAPGAALEAARAARVLELLFEPSSVANDALPRLHSFACSPEQRGALSSALARWFVQASKRTPLLIAADDVERLDDASLALLATLAQRARTHALILLAATEQAAGASLPTRLEALSSRCSPLALRALELPETERLLGSVFGDVPNLALLSARIHAPAAGSPRQIMALAQYLVDRGTISYDGGSWSLPEQLTAADMPASALDAQRARIDQLSPLARRLAEVQALCAEPTLSHEDYELLAPEDGADALQGALNELTTQQLLSGDPRGYRLESRVVAGVLSEGLDEATRRERYAALARMNEQSRRHVFGTARYWLLAGEQARGADLLIEFVRSVRDRVEFIAAARISPDEAAHTLELALSAAQALGRRPRDCFDLRNWLTMLSVSTDDRYYWVGAQAWREQLELDSGLRDYWRLQDEVPDSGQRLMRALTDAGARYTATPEAERVYNAEEAIRLLVHYVVLSIAIGARAMEAKLIRSLPELLEPFAALSPLVAAIWQNALATQESGILRQPERARGRWLDVYERLGQVTSPDPQIVASIRYAIVFGLGLGDASLGIPIDHWAEILDADPMQRVNAMYLRKVARLQQGDLDGAERCRKQAELLALQSSTRQMFNSLLGLEISVHAAAWDLTGVKQIAARIEPLAERHPGWVQFRHLAEGHYQRLVGNFEAAAAAYARCLELAQPKDEDSTRALTAWPTAVGAYVETLLALGRFDEAHALATEALEICERLEIRVSAFDIVRALGLAEAKRGDYAQGAARIERLIAQQRELGVTGLNLGASYEARARIAIWAGDQPAVERFGKLTADQYRHGRGSTLGARYERLMEEARGAGVLILPELSPFETTIFGGTEMGTRVNATLAVASAMTGAHDSRVRAQRALQLLCDSRGSRGGHLYLAQNSELRLAASSLTTSPDDMLSRLVSDFWSQQADDTDPDTAMLSDSAMATQVWTDAEGKSFRPLLLSGKLNGEPVTAGVVLFASDASSADGDVDMPLTTELASFLLRTGDSIRPSR
ncbi:MAG TPA: serine/threonine-protein kinase [Polyangiales bacterium]|nr:serine/threonine-protein kinase [Polyangiales bacterium]